MTSWTLLSMTLYAKWRRPQRHDSLWFLSSASLLWVIQSKLTQYWGVPAAYSKSVCSAAWILITVVCVVKLVKMLSQAACFFSHTCFLKLKKEEAHYFSLLLPKVVHGVFFPQCCFYVLASFLLNKYRNVSCVAVRLRLRLNHFRTC